MSTPEGKVKAMVNRALKEYEDRGLIWKFMPVQTGYGTTALDYLLCVAGRFVVIETKIPKKDLTPLQNATRRMIESAGGRVFVVKDKQSLLPVLEYIRVLTWDDENPFHPESPEGRAWEIIRCDLK